MNLRRHGGSVHLKNTLTNSSESGDGQYQWWQCLLFFNVSNEF